MRFSLRQLQVFIATARHQSISKAAEELAMSQSATSGALLELEKQFDIKLFDRIGKRLQTNELGYLLRPRAEALMTLAQELEQDLLLHKQASHLKIGATLTIGNYLCISLIQAFTKKWPESRVELDVNNTHHITQELLNFQIDLGMVEGELQHPELEVIPWQKDKLVCFCSANHPLAKTGKLTEASFVDAPWVMREPGSGTRQVFDRSIGERLHKLNIVLELQHTEAIKHAVEAGMGISCLSEISLAKDFQRGTFVALNTPFLDLERWLYLIIHKKKYRSAGIINWLDICQNHRFL